MKNFDAKNFSKIQDNFEYCLKHIDFIKINKYMLERGIPYQTPEILKRLVFSLFFNALYGSIDDTRGSSESSSTGFRVEIFKDMSVRITYAIEEFEVRK